MMYSAYKLNKQGDSIQPWCIPFLIWNQSVVPCPVLTNASWLAYRFLKRQVRWSGIPISFRIFQFVAIYIVQGFSVMNKAEIDVFLEVSHFFNDPMDVGNLVCGSFTFSKTNLNIWKFMRFIWRFTEYWSLTWRILNITLLECKMSANCVVVWTFFGVALLWHWNENWHFPGQGHCWVFKICWYIECSTFTASSLRIWNSSTGFHNLR